MTTTTTPRAIVLYDGDCAFCRKSVSLLGKLDWLDRLEYRSCREPANIPEMKNPLVLERMIEEMHVVTPDRQRAFAGFRAFRWIAGRLPLLWVFVPVLYIPGVPQLGQKLYLKIAKNRFNLVPCHDGQCSIPVRKKA